MAAKKPLVNSSGSLQEMGTGDSVPVANGGVPTGGTSGQVLTKVDATDFNLSWSTPSGGGGGSSITISLTAPVSPVSGSAWFHTGYGRTFIYDGTTWIEDSAGIPMKVISMDGGAPSPYIIVNGLSVSNYDNTIDFGGA